MDEKLRQDLAPPGGPKWEEAKAFSAKALLTKSRKVYGCRKDHVKLPASDLAKYMKWMDRLLLGPGQHAEAVAAEVPPGAEAPGEASGEGEGGEAIKEKAKKKVGEKKEDRDFSAAAMKQVSVTERTGLDLRDDGFEYGEVDLESFFSLLFRLKHIHGHLWPPRRDPAKEAAAAAAVAAEAEARASGKKKKKKKGEAAGGDGIVVADSFYDLGCGCGKVVFAAALFFQFASSGGTEMLQGLTAAGKELAGRWKDDLAPTLPGTMAEVAVNIEGNDLLKSLEWEKASFFFLNGPTFTDHLLTQLSLKANGKAVRPESVAIVVSRPWSQLDRDKWVLIAEDTLKMSWGAESKVFVYEKLPEKKKATASGDMGKKKAK